MAPSIADENYARSLSDGYGKPESKMTLCDVWLVVIHNILLEMCCICY